MILKFYPPESTCETEVFLGLEFVSESSGEFRTRLSSDPTQYSLLFNATPVAGSILSVEDLKESSSFEDLPVHIGSVLQDSKRIGYIFYSDWKSCNLYSSMMYTSPLWRMNSSGSNRIKAGEFPVLFKTRDFFCFYARNQVLMLSCGEPDDYLKDLLRL